MPSIKNKVSSFAHAVVLVLHEKRKFELVSRTAGTSWPYELWLAISLPLIVNFDMMS
jgi:hypothetical protein